MIDNFRGIQNFVGSYPRKHFKFSRGVPLHEIGSGHAKLVGI